MELTLIASQSDRVNYRSTNMLELDQSSALAVIPVSFACSVS